MKQVNIRIPLRILALVMGLFLSLGAYAQITVNGNVKDATGEPIIGASVRVVGTQMGTATDLDGNFTLAGVPEGAKLQISSVGYDTQEVSAASNVVVTMSEGSQMLENLVVIGYGVVKKNDLTGSVTALKPDGKNKGVVVAAQDMLAGKIAGVNVTSGGGTPGGGATIRIRGGSSLNASNDPLIVIDGVPIDNNGIKGLSNGLATINPQDIESFNVLKDASATAIYGSRGSNGVIIITTKKGRRGQRPSIAYNGSFTVSKKKKSIDVMDGDEYREFVKQMYAGNAREEEALATLGTANTDWQDEIYRTALSHDHNLTLTGSVGDYLPYRLSVGYTDQQGIMKTSDFKRFTTAVNLNPSLLNDHLRLNLNGKFMWAHSQYADGSAINAAVWMDPTQPVTTTDSKYSNFGGYFEWLTDANALNDSSWPMTVNSNATANPVAILDLKDDRAISRSFTGNADFDYQIHGWEDMRLHLTLGADLGKGKQWTDVSAASPLSAYYGSHGWEQIIKRAYTLSTYAQYYKDFNEDHHFDLMAGYEWQHFWRRVTNSYWGLYPETNNDASKRGTEYSLSTYKYLTENYLVSFFGRLNYIYKNRYYFTATLREDGSSRFEDHWALFPSFAFAWRLKDEGALRDCTTLSDLKLRLGWGKTGQQDVGQDYGWIATYGLSTNDQGSYYDVTGDGTMVRPNTRNGDLKWETTTTTNVGLDWGFLNQRISGSIDWYYRKTTDLINYAYNAAGTQPRNQMYKNIGSLRNTGLEFAISWKAVQATDWNWTLDYNITWNDNEITELIGGDDEDYYVATGGISSGTGNTVQAHAVGHPASSFLVYQQVYDADGMPIEGQVVDRNGDGVISPEDMYYYKDPAADVTMGLASRLEYKNWDFGMSFRASLGNYVFNDLMAGASNVNTSEILGSVNGNYLTNRPTYVLPYNWLTYNQTSILSDRWVQNGSFLKCDNITLGYSFAGLCKGATWDGINGRVYGTVSNVFCITKYKGIDPEVFGGIDNAVYPRPISFIIGLSLNF